jgi:SAM-dependent methyltransferase
MASELEPSIQAHYGRTNLVECLFAALEEAGADSKPLRTRDLAGVDQFHTGGRGATLRLAELAGVAPGERVLDIGGGVGGAARTLAETRGCSVVVVDPVEDYCRAGQWLTERTGLGERVTFQPGRAERIPFAEPSSNSGAGFDLVWLQHCTMNVEDKDRLFREAARVLRPGGRIAMHEIMEGKRTPIHFPVPWARGPELSFLAPPASIRTRIPAAGFRELRWEDETEIAREWFATQSRRAAGRTGPPPVGIHLLLGREAPTMFRNMVANLNEGRLSVIQAVFEKA